MSKRHGAFPMPGKGTPPAEIRVEWNRYFLALPVVAGVVTLTWWRVGIPAAAAVTFVLITGGLLINERRYNHAAAAVPAKRPMGRTGRHSKPCSKALPNPDDVPFGRRKAQVDPAKTAHHRGP